MYKFYKSKNGGIKKAQVLKSDRKYAYLHRVPLSETCILLEDLHDTYEEAKKSNVARFLE